MLYLIILDHCHRKYIDNEKKQHMKVILDNLNIDIQKLFVSVLVLHQIETLLTFFNDEDEKRDDQQVAKERYACKTSSSHYHIHSFDELHFCIVLKNQAGQVKPGQKYQKCSESILSLEI